MLHRVEPDAVLLDLMLPKLSGIDLLRKLRSEAKFKALPVVVFSNASGTDMMEKACNAGATHYLSKYNSPPKQVADLIHAALSDKAGSGGGVFAAVEGVGSGSAKGAPAPTPPPPKPTKTWELPEVEVPAAPSILLLEDNDGMAELLKIFLEAQAFRVTRVTGGGEGLRQVMQEEFDAILCDMVMPNMP